MSSYDLNEEEGGGQQEAALPTSTRDTVEDMMDTHEDPMGTTTNDYLDDITEVFNYGDTDTNGTTTLEDELSAGAPDVPSAAQESDTNPPVKIPLDDPMYRHIHTAQEYALLSLVILLDKIQAPRYMFKEILDWARDSARKNFDFLQQHPTRETFLKKLKKTIHVPKPLVKSIELEHDANNEDVDDFGAQAKVKVHTFDAEESLRYLLNDHQLWGNIDNLNVHSTDRWSPYPQTEHGKSVSSVPSGQWYQEMVARRRPQPGKDLEIPLEIYIDRTPIDGLSRYGVEPVMLTTALFTQETLANPNAWVHLGFVTDTEKQSKAGKSQNIQGATRKGRRVRNYHRILLAILQSLIDLQKKGPIRCFVRLGDEV